MVGGTCGLRIEVPLAPICKFLVLFEILCYSLLIVARQQERSKEEAQSLDRQSQQQNSSLYRFFD